MASADKPDRYGAPWSRDELVLAFDLYCRIPFKKTKANNPAVIELARILRRSSAGVARKLGNFGAFDPELQKKGIVGLAHSSKLDHEIWKEFNANWNQLVVEARCLREQLQSSVPRLTGGKLAEPTGPSEKEAMAKTRLHQSFFRQAVLSSYEETCCITGLGIPACLVASHIVPWAVDERRRTDPCNGICLSATFDRLFDRGLLTISEDLHVVIASGLLKSNDKKAVEMICCFHDNPIIRPHRFLPSLHCLEWHRNAVFSKRENSEG